VRIQAIISGAAARRPALGIPRRRIHRWLGIVLLIAVALGATQTHNAVAGTDRASLGDVEAAYLYNFGKFVRWPDDPGHGPVLICVAGKDPFAQTVAHLVTGERLNDRPLQVRNLERPDAVQGCSILFVGAGQRAQLDGYLAAAAGKPILTVGDSPDFLARGGIVQFIFDENHVRFSVNLNAANRNGLSLSSQLLKVAVSIVGNPGTGGAR
jgi:YfiR/HmsC-like